MTKSGFPQKQFCCFNCAFVACDGVAFYLKYANAVRYIENKSESSKICSLAGLLSKANVEFQAEFLLDRDLIISGNNIFIGDVSANWHSPNVNLVAGTIEIKKTNQLEVKNV